MRRILTLLSSTPVQLATVGVALIVCLAAYQRNAAAPMMTETARQFLVSLTPEQAEMAKIPFESEERFNFHFIPRERKGLPLRRMSPHQKHLASALLSAGLSQQGYIKATTIMSLEDVLRILENDSGERRNPEGYFFSVFGEPSETGTWGYRVEGHHMSLNFTLAGGKVVGSPNFFGSNPAEVRQGPRKGLRALGREEDLGRALYTALDAEQRKVALVDAKAYPDILTMASRKASIQGQPNGLAMDKMTRAQKDMLTSLVEEYARNLQEQMAEARMEQVRKAGGKLFFAWAGTEEKGGPHYYRVQGPTFLIEYDNTQNNANHVHSVWRDLTGDFGQDLLGQHYKTADSHHGHTHGHPHQHR